MLVPGAQDRHLDILLEQGPQAARQQVQALLVREPEIRTISGASDRTGEAELLLSWALHRALPLRSSAEKGKAVFWGSYLA